VTDRSARTREVRGNTVPRFLYGTAWKEEATESLVGQALDSGFRGIDTANQRKHYHEEGVGKALARVLEAGELRREDLFIQTKFTFLPGQDRRLPYDPGAPVAEQVKQSFESSLVHLGLDHLDSLVLHGPMYARGLAQEDRDAWQAMEALANEGRVRLLGISNVSSQQLVALLDLATVVPAFVQNRCFASRGWDHQIRSVCEQHDMVYQGFSLLTANPQVLASADVGAIATRHGRTPAQVVFRFCLGVGMLPLTGTTDAAHMAEDLGAYDFDLSQEELEAVERAGSSRW